MNNSQIKVQSILDSVDKRIQNVRSMSDEDIEEFEAELKKATEAIRGRTALVSLLAGREISDKAFETLSEKPEFLKAVEEGSKFETKQIPYYDQKAKKIMYRTAYFSTGAAMLRNANEKVLSEEDVLSAKFGINRYELRRDKNQSKMDAVSSAKKAIKRVRREKKDAELRQEIIKKDIRIKSVAELGKILMDAQPVQKITPEMRV